MTTDQAQILVIINRVLAGFPSSSSATGDDVVDAYLIGLGQIPVPFVAKAAQEFLSGAVPGHNLAFAPSPAQFGERARKLWHADIEESQHRIQAVRQIEQRGEIVEKTPDSRERVRAMMADFAAKAAKTMRTDDAAEKAREREQVQARMDARFAPDSDPDAVAQRLGMVRTVARSE